MNHFVIIGLGFFLRIWLSRVYFFQCSEKTCAIQPCLKCLTSGLGQDFTFELLCLCSVWLLLTGSSTQITNMFLLMMFV